MASNGKNSGRFHHLRRILPSAMLDGLIVYAAFTLLFFTRAIVTELDNPLTGLGFTLLSILITVGCLYLFRVYHRIWDRTSGNDVIDIVYAVFVATLVEVLINMVIIAPRYLLPMSVLLLGNALSLLGFVAVRYRMRVFTGLRWRLRALLGREIPGRNEIPVLVVGAGESGSAFVWRLKNRWEAREGQNYKIIGYIDDDPAKQGMFIEGVRVLGDRQEIPEIVRNRRVELIVIAIHNISGPAFREILAACEGTSARIKIVPDMYAMLNQRLGVATLRDVQPEDILGRKLVGRHQDVDMTPVTGKVALVTGAAGSIGSELVRQLISYEPTLLVMLDNNESGLHDLYTELKPQFPDVEFRPVLADITQRDSLERVYATYRPQIVFHAAAYKHVPMLELFPHESIRVNIGGTRNLAELARDYGVERFVLISTDKAVDPSCVMGASKRAAELLMKALSAQSGHTTLFTAVRFGNVLGSRGSVAPTFNRQIDKGGPVTVTDKDMKRYFMTIAEAVNLVIHAAAMTTGGELFMLQMGEEVPILELAERMIRMRGLRPYDDIEIKFTGVRPGEKLNEKLQRDSEVQVSTIHPHIVKLEDRDDWFDAELFMRQSAEVIRIDPNDLGVVEQAQALVRDGRLYSEKAATKMYFDYLVRLIDQERPTGPKLVKPEVPAPAVARQWPSNGHARDVVN